MKKNILYILLLTLFSFAVKAQQTYYWVGGSGDWSDFSHHWATTSGGTTFHATIPGIDDNVVFDENSFTGYNETVRLDVIANIKNFTVKSSLQNEFRFSGNNDFNIYGDINLSDKVNIYPDIYLRGSGSISTNGASLERRLWLDTSGIYKLASDFIHSKVYFYLVNGTFDTQGYKFVARNLSDFNSKERLEVILGSSTIEVRDFDLSPSTGVQVILDAGTSTIKAQEIGFDNSLNFYNIILSYVSGNNNLRLGSFYTKNEHANINKLIINTTDVINATIGCDIEAKDVILKGNLSFLPKKEFKVTNSFTIEHPINNNCNSLYLFNVDSNSYNDRSALALILELPTNTIFKDYIISDIESVNPLMATNCIDNGGNSNIRFTNTPVENALYWIGGSGDWADPAHWSVSSGGGAANCLPQANTNVIFDSNSGFGATNNTVMITEKSQVCHDFTVNTGQSIIFDKYSSYNENIINIYGSIDLESSTNVKASLSFLSKDTGETIRTNGNQIESTITFEGYGEWTLQDELNTTSWVILNKGHLNTNNQKVRMNNLLARSYFSKTLELGSSQIYILDKASFYEADELTLDAGTSHIHFLGGGSSSTSSFLSSLEYRFYDVSFEGGTNRECRNLSANKVFFAVNSSSINSGDFNELKLSAGKSYSFERSINIHNKFIAKGTDCNFINLEKSKRGYQQFVFDNTTDCEIDYAVIKGINVIKNTPIDATHSIDLGDNTNINFTTSPASKDMYWIGRTGEWNDPANWGDSNGTPLNCIPTAVDNVFFNANSFNAGGQQVIVSQQAYCNNMTWKGATGNPVIVAHGYNDIDVNGSIEIQEDMVFNLHLNLVGEGKTITSNNGTFKKDVNIYGSYQLQDDIKVSEDIRFYGKNKVSLKSNGHKISAEAIRANGRIQLDIKNSIVKSVSLFLNPVDIIATNSTIIMLIEKPYFYVKDDSQFNKIIFEDIMKSGSTNGNIFGNFTANEIIVNANIKNWKSRVTTKKLIVAAGSEVEIASGNTITVSERAELSGNNCNRVKFYTTSNGQANLKVLKGPDSFNYVNIKNINATGKTLNFGPNSQDGGDNTNINFSNDPSGTLTALGSNVVLCNEQSQSYTISANGYYNPDNASIKWYKDGTEIPGETQQNLTVTETGEYKIEIKYGDGCIIDDSIHVDFVKLPAPTVTSQQDIQYFSVSDNATIADLKVDYRAGTTLKWYDSPTATIPLSPTTLLVDGEDYYATQTKKDCESRKSIKVLVKITGLSTSFITTWTVEAGDTSIIIPVQSGSYDYNIYWEEITNANHKGSFMNVTGSKTIDFGSAGTYRVEIGGTFPKIYFREDTPSNNNNDEKIRTVEQWGNIVWGSFSGSFSGCKNLDVVANDIPNLSQVEDLSDMFRGCSSLIGNDQFNNWDTANITNMDALFYGAKKFNQPLNNWDTSKVTDMDNLFHEAYVFNHPLNNWDTSEVTTMRYLFSDARKFNQDISNWNTAKVTNMQAMFSGATDFNNGGKGMRANGNLWNTSNVENMSFMFKQATSFNQPITNWNTAKVKTMSSMFYGANIFNQPLNNWNTAKVTDMANMFRETFVFNQVLNNWDTSKVKDMRNMFMDAHEFNQDISNWDTAKVTNMIRMFANAYKFNNGGNSLKTNGNRWNTSKVTNMVRMFYNARVFNQSIENWDTSKITSMKEMFYQAYNFNQDIGNWDVSAVTNMEELFNECNLSSYNFSKLMKNWANASFNLSTGNTNWGDSGLRYAESAIDNNTISNLQAKGLQIQAQVQANRGTGVIYKEGNNWNNGYTLVGTKENGAFEWLADYTTYDAIGGAPTILLVFKRSGTNLNGDIVVKADSHLSNQAHIYKLQNEVVGQQETRPATDVINGREHKVGIIVYDPANGHYYEAITNSWVRIDN